MPKPDMTRINEIMDISRYQDADTGERCPISFETAALISIENQLHRIAEALAKQPPAPEEPEAENALDRKLEHEAVMDLLHMFLNAAEEKIVNGT